MSDIGQDDHSSRQASDDPSPPHPEINQTITIGVGIMNLDSAEDESTRASASTVDISNELCEQDSAGEANQSFPPLRRVGSYPLSSSSAPPRRPSRSSSFEGKNSVGAYMLKTEEEAGDEYDHQQFRRLLLGSDSSSSEDKDDARGIRHVASCSTLPRLCYQKSASSAPPKIPCRMGSDSEKEASTRSRLPATTCHRQWSLPLAGFRPRPVRRRRRSRIQDMLDSENGSSSTPRLPNRTGSDRSGTSDGVPEELVLCPSTPASAKSSTTDAPKLPRRSLSPMCSRSVRSLFNNTSIEIDEEDEDDEADESNLVVHVLPTTKGEATATLLPPGATASKVTATSRKIRKLPVRAKTCSFRSSASTNEKEMLIQIAFSGSPSRDSCISLLSTTNGVNVGPSGSDLLNTSMGSLWSSTTWPKPRKTRVAPGRSRTFSFHQKGAAGMSRF